jgi:hypothetical protein
MGKFAHTREGSGRGFYMRRCLWSESERGGEREREKERKREEGERE